VLMSVSRSPAIVRQVTEMAPQVGNRHRLAVCAGDLGCHTVLPDRQTGLKKALADEGVGRHDATCLRQAFPTV